MQIQGNGGVFFYNLIFFYTILSSLNNIWLQCDWKSMFD